MDNKPQGEADHCRNRLIKYCVGQGLDLGCGNVKIKSEAIGIDLINTPASDMRADARLMPFYPDNFFDYIFSSHLLEEIEDTQATLQEWLRIIKPGGFLALYQADREYYHPIGTPQCNPRHRHHFLWEDLWGVLRTKTILIHSARYSPENGGKEWSFELVVQKL